MAASTFMLWQIMRELLYKFAWDTRCRNIDVARVLRPLLSGGSSILDAGCGEYGLAAFMPDATITGIDIVPPETVAAELKYVHGSILDMPFDDGSYDIAVSVDVLEHLSADLRPAAIGQLVRVARKVVVITFPDGERARKIDVDFEADLISRDMPSPEWLAEHLADRYPETDETISAIQEKAEKLGRKVSTRVAYSEHSAVARFLRWSAARSKYLYISGNLLAGFLRTLMPQPSAETAYRAIIVAEFDN